MHSAASRATLMPLSCSPNFPRAQYLDIRTLTHQLIVKYIFCVTFSLLNVKMNSSSCKLLGMFPLHAECLKCSNI